MKLKYFVTNPLGTISAEYATANNDSRSGKKASRIRGFLAAAALTLLLTVITAANPASRLTIIDGSIVVIDDDLFVDCDGDQAVVYWTKVYNSSDVLVATFDGCGSNSCVYSVYGLSKGYYRITVNTSAGQFTHEHVPVGY